MDELSRDAPTEPTYLRLTNAELRARVDAAMAELQECRACPRNCGINRMAGETKFCGSGRYARVSSAFPHMGEEDCLRGYRGSGTIFFSQCNLQCVFCQNWDISQQPTGPEMTAEEIADLMLTLQDRGCHNINFVTPEHVVPQVIEATTLAIARGLNLPIVYNTSAYDSISSLRLLDGLIDIYMPDFKFWSRESAKELCKAKDYPERAREAILEMHRQVGPLQLGPDGVARRGVLVRHLVMPGQGEETAEILHWLAREVSTQTYVNLLSQYHPDHLVSKDPARYQAINRRPGRDEFAAAVAAARAAGLNRLEPGWL